MCSSYEEIREAFKAFSPIGRIGEVEDVARAAAFLADEKNGFVTGANIQLDGGILPGPESMQEDFLHSTKMQKKIKLTFSHLPSLSV